MKSTNIDFAKLHFAQPDIKKILKKSTDSNAAVMFG
jgi:hypothetical protein